MGARVVCVGVDRGWRELGGGFAAGPSVGDVCTIRASQVINGHAALWFEEHRNVPIYRPAIGRVVEYAFEAKFFRPLVTIEDDIATHFVALLDVREPEGV